MSFPKRQDVIEFVTEADNIFLESMPDTRKFIRMALPGEKHGPIEVGTPRYIFQNDQGALFKGSTLAKWGMWTCNDLAQAMLCVGGLENLFYRSMKIISDKSVPFNERQQASLIGRGFIDTVVYKKRSQIPNYLWRYIEGNRLEVFCTTDNETKTKDGNNIMFFNDYYEKPKIENDCM